MEPEDKMYELWLDHEIDSDTEESIASVELTEEQLKLACLQMECTVEMDRRNLFTLYEKKFALKYPNLVKYPPARRMEKVYRAIKNSFTDDNSKYRKWMEEDKIQKRRRWRRNKILTILMLASLNAKEFDEFDLQYSQVSSSSRSQGLTILSPTTLNTAVSKRISEVPQNKRLEQTDSQENTENASLNPERIEANSQKHSFEPRRVINYSQSDSQLYTEEFPLSDPLIGGISSQISDELTQAQRLVESIVILTEPLEEGEELTKATNRGTDILLKRMASNPQSQTSENTIDSEMFESIPIPPSQEYLQHYINQITVSSTQNNSEPMSYTGFSQSVREKQDVCSQEVTSTQKAAAL